MRDSIAEDVEGKPKRSRFLVYGIKGGCLANSEIEANVDTRKEALDWIKQQSSSCEFAIIEAITGGDGEAEVPEA